MNKKAKKLSLAAVFLVICVTAIQIVSEKAWKKPDGVIINDAMGYYIYAPSALIYHDMSLQYVDQYQGKHNVTVYWPVTEKGIRYCKYPYGVALMHAPFVLIGHLIAGISDYPADGFSEPYKFMLLVGGLLYLLIGLIVLRKCINTIFSDSIAAIVILIIGFGTNLWWYLAYESAMSHQYSFVLFVLFIWQTIRWYENSTFLRSIMLGVITGIVMMIRPSNLVLVLFFILYDIKNRTDVKNRIQLWYSGVKYLVVIVITAFIIIVPQLPYWKYVSGEWLFYSYQDEHFFFNKPQLIKGLFSYRNGWLLYTPFMLVAISGISFLYRNHRKFFFPVLIFFLVNTYVILSWWCWWYGGSFGNRAFTDSYGIMAIPLAAIIQFLTGKKRIRIIFFLLVGSLIAMNVFFMYKYKYGSIHYSCMSREAFWNSFFRIKPTWE
jgi:hypothetical protein